MKRRSGTTTVILVVALLVGLAFVGAAVNPPPKAPEKTAEKGSMEQDPDAAKKAMAYQEEQIKKSKGEYKAKMEGEARWEKQKQLEPAAKDHPTQMYISNDYYRQEQDGDEGTKKLDVRVEKATEQIQKLRAQGKPVITNANPGKPVKRASEN